VTQFRLFVGVFGSLVGLTFSVLPAYAGAVANSGYQFAFTNGGQSYSVNWNNGGFGDFSISDGAISTGASDAFDAGAKIDLCSSASCSYTSAFSEYTGIGTATSSTLYQGALVNNLVPGLNATVSYKFSETSASMRILVKLDNTTSSSLTRTVRLRSGLGCDGGCYMKYQSSGGSSLSNYFSPGATSYTTSSYWTIQSDNSGTSPSGSGADPIVSFAYGTSGAASSPSTTITNSGADNLFTTIDPTIPANSTRYLIFVLGFGGVSKTTNTLADAYSGVNSLFSSWESLPTDIKSDLSADELSRIVNWSIGPNVANFSTSQSSPTNILTSGTISYSLVLSQSVSDLATGDFQLGGTSTCNTPGLSGSGTTYTVTLTNCTEGTVILQLKANSVTGTSAGPPAVSSANTVIVDRTAPTISSVSTTNGNYQATSNASMNFTVGFSESVTVTGTPRIPITIGSTTRYANFLSLTDSRTATFRFTVSVNYDDIDLNGIAVNSPLELNSGSIADLATNAMTSLTFTPPVTSSVNVYQPPSAPTIDSITANNASLTIYFSTGSANGSTVSNYRYSLNGGAFTALSPTDAASPITITGLTNGTTYSIKIKAVSNLGDGLESLAMSSAPSASASVSITLTASATTATKGTGITITAQVSQAGQITFFWNDKRITGCIKRAASSSATCQWKPTVTGQWSIQALLDPTDSAYVNSYSQKLPVFILKRTGTR
jgi:hypothetical protein